MTDLTDIDETFKFTEEVVKNTVKVLLEKQGQRMIKAEYLLEVTVMALMKNFSVEQIYTRLKKQDRKMMLEFLTPNEILILSDANLIEADEDDL